MAPSTNAPHYVLAVVKRIYSDLPFLLSPQVWKEIQASVDDRISKLEAQPNSALASTQLLGLLWPYEPVRLGITNEIMIQKVISANITERMKAITASLGVDQSLSDNLSAAAYATMKWEVDPQTIPLPGESVDRTMTFTRGRVDAATSMKFSNMRLTFWDFAKISSGFVMTASSIVDQPYPIVIAAGVLLTLSSIQDAVTTELSAQEASVFWGMIQATGSMTGAGLSITSILAKTNEEREHYGLGVLDEKQVRGSLSKLSRIKSIRQTRETYQIIEQFVVED